MTLRGDALARETSWLPVVTLLVVIFGVGASALLAPRFPARVNVPSAPARATDATAQLRSGPWKWPEEEERSQIQADYAPIVDLPPQLESGPIRARLLVLLEGRPPRDPLDTMDVTLHEWCVHEVSSALGITVAEAHALMNEALLSSATTAGDTVLTVLERAAMPTAEHLRARRMCAVELFYALPGDEP